ncbi:eukaryotic translation initiation factor 3 subunit 7 (eIF-3) [Actinidia rufa]|uniref:Eukaryotic translation initiation factor 3 subunit D n=1 Tax=Actinidia rufa TaxID=165716 RepID=A0A7J0FXX6_9ERIC|nr:eukaryotic translation initiation factor 3 subunit 7 (eIF-3) [Actinidia rufa]
MVGFDVGTVPFNSDGWGPPEPESSSHLLPNHPSNVPFAPFSRSDKLGRIADWTRNFNNQNRNPSNPRYPSDSVFDFAGDESFGGAAGDEDSSFRLVDGRPRRAPSSVPGGDSSTTTTSAATSPSAATRRSRPSAATPRRSVPAATASTTSTAPAETPPAARPPPSNQDLLLCGALEFYDRTYDRITPKNSKPLERFKNRNFFKVTTTDDPVIRRLANEDKATVFATDSILSTLMCAPRSVYSWDIVIQRVGNKLFFDKRDGSQLDLLSVHETSQEPLPEAKDDINSAYSLSVEAAYINQNFSQQVLIRDGNKVGFEEGNPFASDGEEVASVAYRYRRWKLDDEMYLVARCEVQSVAEVNNQRSFLTLNALNEFDPKYSGVDWRQKLETQRGAVLATELKNNANKLAKWTSQALLASADMMKLGYVSRVHPRDHFNHVILAVVGYKPKDFAAQINLNTSNMWGIVKSIVDLCMKLNEGKYVLVKDPSKPQVRIYEVPADAFENDYMEEPLPEEEQVQPPAEDVEGGEAIATTNDVEDKEITNEA